MSKVFATYKAHHKVGDPEGHIFLDRDDLTYCTITLNGAASMPQHELNRYAYIMTEALNREIEDE